MTMQFRFVANLLAMFLLISSCAPDPYLPTPEMKHARDAIAHAKEVGAQRYAQPDLEEAEAAYKQAEDAHRHGDNAVAKTQAVLAANLATRAASLASNSETQRAATEVQRSPETKQTTSSAHPDR